LLFSLVVITPLLPATFTKGSVQREFDTEMGDASTLISLETQATELNTNALRLAYGITWLNQTLPPYMTREFATLPFRPRLEATAQFSSETWTTIANVYQTNLTCKPAIIERLPPDSFAPYRVDSGEGCRANVSFPRLGANGPKPFETHNQANHMLVYYGWDSDAQVTNQLEGPDCPKEHSNKYLAAYATSSGRTDEDNYPDLQAIFCQPSYTVEAMRVTVNATTGTVVKAQALPESERTVAAPTLDSVFNRTLFERLVGTGLNTNLERAVARKSDIPGTVLVEPYSRTLTMDVAWPLTNVAGFALGINERPLQELSDPEKLCRLFEKTHQIHWRLGQSPSHGEVKRRS
jgi:hypothetical protein